jgi:hypothetical protein
MDITTLRNCYKSICHFYSNDFTVSDPSKLVEDKSITDILFRKFNFNFVQIDSNLYMHIENDNYHLVKVNDDKSIDYLMFTRIERHDDSCTYVKNIINNIK